MLEFEAGTTKERLDRFLASRLAEVSLTRIRGMISEGTVLVNGAGALPGLKLASGDRISITSSLPSESAATPEQIPLDVIYEDSEIIVVNKPSGLLVHPSNKVRTGTLTNALSYHFLVSGQRGPRTGLVHRLDGNTSGVIVVAKTARAHRLLSNAFRERLVSKTYITVVRGRVEAESGTIVAPIGYEAGTWPRWKVIDTGRAAETRYIVKQRFDEYTLLELEPLTGRTHQIRIHCAFIGHPVVGDPFYGRTTDDSSRQLGLKHHLLHALRLEFTHPATRARMSFQAPIPETFVRLIATLSST